MAGEKTSDTTVKRKRRTALELFIDQVTALRAEITGLEKTLEGKRAELAKFEQAKKLFEA